MRNHYVYPNGKMVLTIINQKVCEGTINGVMFKREDRAYIVDGYRFEHNKEIFTLPFDTKFFASEEELKKGFNINPDSTSDCCCNISGNSDLNSIQYYSNDGKIAKWNILDNVDSYIYTRGGKIESLSGFVPKKLYQSEYGYYRDNDLIVYKDNGDIEIKEAPLKKIKLNDKQKELFERFKTITKEMRENNMLAILNNSNDYIGVINRPYDNCDWCGTYGEGSEYFWDIIPDEQFFNPSVIWSVTEEWEVTI